MNPFSSSEIFGEVQVDAEAKSLLKTTTTWARIVAIIGLLSATGTLVTTLFGSQRANNPLASYMSATLFMIIPFVIAVVILNLFLLRFATTTAESLEHSDQTTFNRGISFLRMYLKTLGILIIILIGLCILIFIAFALGTAFR